MEEISQVSMIDKEEDKNIKLGPWNQVIRKPRAKNQGGKSNNMGKEKYAPIHSPTGKVGNDINPPNGLKFGGPGKTQYDKGCRYLVLDPKPLNQKAQDPKAKKRVNFDFNSGPPYVHRVKNPLGGKNPQSGNKGNVSKGKGVQTVKKKNSVKESTPIKATAERNAGKATNQKPDFDMHQFRILMRQQNDVFKSSFSWKNPLDEAEVAMDEETLAFVENQRMMKIGNGASPSNSSKECEMELESHGKVGSQQDIKETESHPSEEISQ